MSISTRLLLVAALIWAGCGTDPEPEPPKPPEGPKPCALAANADRLEIARGGSAELTLSAAQGDCTVDRVRLDRGVFQIVDEPTAPFTIDGGTDLVLTIRHDPQGALPPGVPTRELVFYEAKHTIEVALVGQAPPQACLRMADMQIIIRGVGLMESGDAPVTVANDCDHVASVVEAELVEGDQSFSLDRRPLPLRVPAMGTADLTLTYRPVVTFPVGGKLRLQTDETQNPTLEVDLIGFPEGPRALVFPERIDVGDVLHQPAAAGPSTCGSREHTFAISNIGERDLRVTALRIDGDIHVEVVRATVGATSVAAPFAVPPGGAAQVVVRAYPTAEGASSGRVLVVHDAGPDPLEVGVSVRGLADAPSRERFQQPPEPRLDLLWVVQDTFSLRFRSDALPILANEVLGLLEADRVQSRVAVTTTDIATERAGALRACSGDPDVQRSEEATLAARSMSLGCALTLRAPPTGAQGIGAAVRAISKWLDRGVFRADAELVVIVVSNYDDQSAIDRDALNTFFAELPGRRLTSGVHVFPIVRTGAECADGQAEAAPRYTALAAATGGQTFDLCATDWRPAAQPIADVVADAPRRYQLHGQPVLASMAVTLDGALVPGRDFSFDTVSGELSFSDPPLGGRMIEVSYDPACAP